MRETGLSVAVAAYMIIYIGALGVIMYAVAHFTRKYW